jgi:branched-chain amino acid transport system substrate-binding protein
VFGIRLKLALLSILVAGQPVLAGTIIFLDNSVSNDTYIPSNKEKQIKWAFDLALSDTKVRYKGCVLNGEVMVGRSGPLNVMEQKKEISAKFKTSDTILVGLIHSSEAILAAKSFSGTNFVAISSGATADNLGEVNQNFFSLANNMNRYGDILSSFMSKDLKAKKVVSLFSGGSFYSRQFAETLQKKLKGKTEIQTFEIDPNKAYEQIQKKRDDILAADIVFTPGFIQETLPVLSALDKIGFKKAIMGTPNWGRSRSDLEVFAKAAGLKSESIYFPVSWLEGESKPSVELGKRFKKLHSEDLMGTALYTYDAAVLAGSFLCQKKVVNELEFRRFLTDEKTKKTSGVIRTYGAPEGNFLPSDVSVVKLNKDRKSIAVRRSY